MDVYCELTTYFSRRARPLQYLDFHLVGTVLSVFQGIEPDSWLRFSEPDSASRLPSFFSVFLPPVELWTVCTESLVFFLACATVGRHGRLVAAFRIRCVSHVHEDGSAVSLKSSLFIVGTIWTDNIANNANMVWPCEYIEIGKEWTCVWHRHRVESWNVAESLIGCLYSTGASAFPIWADLILFAMKYSIHHWFSDLAAMCDMYGFTKLGSLLISLFQAQPCYQRATVGMVSRETWIRASSLGTFVSLLIHSCQSHHFIAQRTTAFSFHST